MTRETTPNNQPVLSDEEICRLEKRVMISIGTQEAAALGKRFFAQAREANALRAEVERLGSLAEEWAGKYRAEQVRAEKAEAQVAALREALKVYAEPGNWWTFSDGGNVWNRAAFEQKGFTIAQDALADTTATAKAHDEAGRREERERILKLVRQEMPHKPYRTEYAEGKGDTVELIAEALSTEQEGG